MIANIKKMPPIISRPSSTSVSKVYQYGPAYLKFSLAPSNKSATTQQPIPPKAHRRAALLTPKRFKKKNMKYPSEMTMAGAKRICHWVISSRNPRAKEQVERFNQTIKMNLR